MATRITCISKDSGNHENPYVAISLLGWTDDATGKQGRSTRIQMCQFIKDGGYAYVQIGNTQAWLTAEVSAHGNPYVKTVADGTRIDNLLTLPECR